MNLWQFYKDNPTLLEAKVGDDLANIAAIVSGTSAKKALNVFVDGGTLALGSIVGSTVTRVPSSTSSQMLVAANSARKGLLFYNDGTALQYIKFGTTATTADFTIRLTGQSFYEVQNPVYNGRIDVVSSSTDGGIQVTELA